jgi:hypothetical protein
LNAEGVARASEAVGDDTEYHLVPFTGQTASGREDYEFKLLYAQRLFNHPIGLKLRYIRKTSAEPTGFTRFTRDGISYDLSHLTWGWATTGCNHIFGYSHINADAFYQDRYSVFAGHQLDLQLSSEFNGNYKSGIRYRTSKEDGDNYSWQYDDGSQFHGNYYIDERWQDRKTHNLIRGYSKVRFWEFGEADAGILFFLQQASHAKLEVNKLADSDPGSRESEREIAVETNPFLNYRFHGGHFDFGLLLEVARIGLKNTQTRWNSVSGSDQTDVLWSTTPYQGWSPSWESFSQGSEWFFATGFEADAAIPVYRRTAALLRLMILRKYTWTTKQYGQSEIPAGSSSFAFRQTHERHNYRNEAWMTGAIGISYGKGPIQSFLTLHLPLAYLIKQKTELADNDQQLFEHEKRNMWQVQEPTSARLLIVYGWGGAKSTH